MLHTKITTQLANVWTHAVSTQHMLVVEQVTVQTRHDTAWHGTVPRGSGSSASRSSRRRHSAGSLAARAQARHTAPARASSAPASHASTSRSTTAQRASSLCHTDIAGEWRTLHALTSETYVRCALYRRGHGSGDESVGCFSNLCCMIWYFWMLTWCQNRIANRWPPNISIFVCNKNNKIRIY